MQEGCLSKVGSGMQRQASVNPVVDTAFLPVEARRSPKLLRPVHPVLTGTRVSDYRVK